MQLPVKEQEGYTDGPRVRWGGRDHLAGVLPPEEKAPTSAPHAQSSPSAEKARGGEARGFAQGRSPVGLSVRRPPSSRRNGNDSLPAHNVVLRVVE